MERIEKVKRSVFVVAIVFACFSSTILVLTVPRAPQESHPNREFALEILSFGLPVPKYSRIEKSEAEDIASYDIQIDPSIDRAFGTLSSLYYKETKKNGWSWVNQETENAFLDPAIPMPPSLILRKEGYKCIIGFWPFEMKKVRFNQDTHIERVLLTLLRDEDSDAKTTTE